MRFSGDVEVHDNNKERKWGRMDCFAPPRVRKDPHPSSKWTQSTFETWSSKYGSIVWCSFTKLFCRSPASYVFHITRQFSDNQPALCTRTSRTMPFLGNTIVVLYLVEMFFLFFFVPSIGRALSAALRKDESARRVRTKCSPFSVRFKLVLMGLFRKSAEIASLRGGFFLYMGVRWQWKNRS